MAVEDHPVFSEWSRAWDAVQSRRRHFSAAKEVGNARLIDAMKARLDEATAAYDAIVGKLDA